MFCIGPTKKRYQIETIYSVDYADVPPQPKHTDANKVFLLVAHLSVFYI